MSDCTCGPCQHPNTGHPALEHCAACCFGTLIEEYDPNCPDAGHREMARRQFPAVEVPALRGFDDSPPF